MKHGIHIPAATRDAFARAAAELAEKACSRAEAIALVQQRFDVSAPTARNLISRGNYLAAQSSPRETKALA